MTRPGPTLQVAAAAVTGFLLLASTRLVAGPPAGGAAAGAQAPRAPQAASTYAPPRNRDGQPDLSGIWQSLNAGAFNLEDHSPGMGVPGGYGLIEGGRIPYLPAALIQRNQNFENRATDDPEVKCYQPGVPRATFMGFPFQIIQFKDSVAIFYEYLGYTRTVFFNGEHPDPEVLEYWMGDSRGRWDGNTLVVDVQNFNAQTWLDKAGNFHGPNLHVVERYTRVSPDRIDYEATLTDPEVYSRPWTVKAPLYRRQEPNLRILEYECHAYMEQEAAKGKVKLPWSTLEFEGTPRK
jgi:hypothetical protein